jgi:hypothetical protein
VLKLPWGDLGAADRRTTALSRGSACVRPITGRLAFRGEANRVLAQELFGDYWKQDGR